MPLLDLKSLSVQSKELKLLLKTLFSKGKSVRCGLVRLIGSHIGLTKPEQQFLCRLVEYIHNSSLLHDDFIDHSSMRRSQKAAWIEFSPEQAVLAGDYLLAQVGIYLANLGNLPLLRLTSEAIMSLVEGEFLQRELIENTRETPHRVKKVSELKTGSLFKWCLQAPFYYKNRKKPQLYNLLDRIGCHIGILFQRSDDLLDFSLRKKENKEAFTDLKQNYLNSFACFLMEKKKKSLGNKLKKVKNFESFTALIPDYKNMLREFDEINQKLIRNTQKDIENLKKFLNPEEKPLIEKLKTVPEFCYWRKIDMSSSHCS